MKIRIKVKQLVYFLGLLMVFVFAFNYGTSSSQKLAEADRGVMQAEKSEQILHMIDSAKPDEQLKLIEEYMLKDDSGDLTHIYDVYIGPDGSMYGGGSSEVDTQPEFNLKEQVPYLELYVQSGTSDPAISTAAKLLTYYYDGSGQWEKAAQLLTEARKRLHITRYIYARDELFMLQAKLAAEHEQYDELLRLCADMLLENKNSINSDTYVRISDLLVEYAMSDGKAAEMLKQIQDEMERQKNQMKDGDVVKLQSEQLQGILDRQNKLSSNKIKTGAEVSGTITKSNGEPLAYAGVFLRREEDINRSIFDMEPYQTMTNGKGEYTFKGVVPNSYKLFLGVNLSQISGWTWPVLPDDGWIDLRGQSKVQEDVVFQPLMELKSPVNEDVVRDKTMTFEWEPVAGAAYYNLNIGMKLHSGSTSRAVRQGITTPRVQVQAEDLYYEISGISSYSHGKEQEQLDPLSLLGYANAKNQFSWSVEAYSADGKLLTRSNGYRLSNDLTGNLPFFYLKERTLTEADEMLLAGKLDDAEAMYEADADRDPSDAHSLHMMLMILKGKTSLLRGAGTADAEEKKSMDAQQIDILKKLVELHPTENYYEWLADYYFKQADWNRYNRYYAIAESMRPFKDNSYSDGNHAMALMKQGKTDEAKVYLKKSIENDKSHRFIGAYLALFLYSGGSLDEGIQLAVKYPDRMGYNTPVDWEELLIAMKRESAINPGYKAVLKDKIAQYNHGKDEELKRWQPASESGLTALKNFMTALAHVS
ncbi:hypothetical protein GRF59_08220 [Paenibacillus sp. HJL G12]|uniref:Carboxypeptidase regulatory-like domain-containing protein n=1 Tax=Paenibacillus dendrobii TaxID=2691084 RepID=A0A7X3IGP4_9BACL|nr:carboxypeptidase-like regulatory domain-containing protein [Paenibacillus dendrobii]MWV43619.1 hypothetical protein [Paenibacillus dendrobii]